MAYNDLISFFRELNVMFWYLLVQFQIYNILIYTANTKRYVHSSWIYSFEHVYTHSPQRNATQTRLSVGSFWLYDVMEVAEFNIISLDIRLFL